MSSTILVEVSTPDQKIKSIKELRAATGYGLREAKELAEQVVDGERPSIDLDVESYALLVSYGWTLKREDGDLDPELVDALAANCLLKRELEATARNLADYVSRETDRLQTISTLRGDLMATMIERDDLQMRVSDTAWLEEARDKLHADLDAIDTQVKYMVEDTSPTVGSLFLRVAKIQDILDR